MTTEFYPIMEQVRHRAKVPCRENLAKLKATLSYEVKCLVTWETNSPQKARRKVTLESVTFEPKNASELKQFFEENKDKCHEIWVIITKKKTANPQLLSFNQALTEAKKQGLIDSRTKTIDEKKYMIRFTKRIKPSMPKRERVY